MKLLFITILLAFGCAKHRAQPESDLIPELVTKVKVYIAAGLIPANFRPTNTDRVSQVYRVDSGKVYAVEIFADGHIGFDYKDWDGTANAGTTSQVQGSISFTVDL